MSPGVTRWLWGSGTLPARIVRAALLPAAGVYGGIMWLRARAYARGRLATRPLPRPAVAVGNLTVGGTGKTPLAAWIASYYAARGVRPGILLRGYGGDEIAVHETRTPGAIVVADPDRRAGAARAAALGAGVLVLDDAFQRLDVARDVNIAVLSVEGAAAAPWPLPAGPWREGWSALERATLIAVTRKRAPAAAAAALADRVAARVHGCPVAIAYLALGGLVGMRSGEPVPLPQLAGHRVLAAAGIGDPASFAEQLRALRATVRLAAFRDHHAYGAADVRRLLRVGAPFDYLIVTEKDAVKLRHLWPRDAREPLVALLDVHWESQADAVRRALDGALGGVLTAGPSPTTDRT